MRQLHEGIYSLHTRGHSIEPKWCMSATIDRHSGQTPLTSKIGADDGRYSQTSHTPLQTISIA